MAKTSTNISLDPELKRSSQELFADLGIDLSTAITEMKAHPEKYKRYASFKDAMNEVLTDA